MKILNEVETIQALRARRERECFKVINRGKIWYDTLTLQQETELRDWYFAWLNVTETKVIPIKPTWLNNKTEQGENLL